MELKPLSDRVVLKLYAQEKKVSGIIVPKGTEEKSDEGEVVAVGPGKYHDGTRIPVDVRVGDRVIFSKYAGQTIEHESEKYVVVREEELMVKIA